MRLFSATPQSELVQCCIYLSAIFEFWRLELRSCFLTVNISSVSLCCFIYLSTEDAGDTTNKHRQNPDQNTFPTGSQPPREDVLSLSSAYFTWNLHFSRFLIRIFTCKTKNKEQEVLEAHCQVNGKRSHAELGCILLSDFCEFHHDKFVSYIIVFMPPPSIYNPFPCRAKKRSCKSL